MALQIAKRPFSHRNFSLSLSIILTTFAVGLSLFLLVTNFSNNLFVDPRVNAGQSWPGGSCYGTETGTRRVLGGTNGKDGWCSVCGGPAAGYVANYQVFVPVGNNGYVTNNSITDACRGSRGRTVAYVRDSGHTIGEQIECAKPVQDDGKWSALPSCTACGAMGEQGKCKLPEGVSQNQTANLNCHFVNLPEFALSNQNVNWQLYVNNYYFGMAGNTAVASVVDSSPKIFGNCTNLTGKCEGMMSGKTCSGQFKVGSSGYCTISAVVQDKFGKQKSCESVVSIGGGQNTSATPVLENISNANPTTKTTYMGCGAAEKSCVKMECPRGQVCADTCGEKSAYGALCNVYGSLNDAKQGSFVRKWAAKCNNKNQCINVVCEDRANKCNNECVTRKDCQ